MKKAVTIYKYIYTYTLVSSITSYPIIKQRIRIKEKYFENRHFIILASSIQRVSLAAFDL